MIKILESVKKDTQKCHMTNNTTLPKLCKHQLSKEVQPTRTLMVVTVCWLQQAFLLELPWQALCFGITGQNDLTADRGTAPPAVQASCWQQSDSEKGETMIIINRRML